MDHCLLSILIKLLFVRLLVTLFFPIKLSINVYPKEKEEIPSVSNDITNKGKVFHP